MKMRVTAIGECMIELSSRQDAWQLAFAGDTFNTLWMMKGRLGESLVADFFSGFGSDPFSRQQIAFMQMGGIGIASSRTDPTFAPGIYGISLSETGERSFTYWREASAARRLADANGNSICSLSILCISFRSASDAGRGL